MNTFHKNSFPLLLVLAMAFVLMTGCKSDDNASPDEVDLVKNEDASVPLEWMKLFLKIDRYTEDFRPGPSSRALAYINLAAYESVMKGMPDYKSLNDLYPELSMPDAGNSTYHYPTVVNAVYANLFKRFLPSENIVEEQQSNLQFDILALEDTNNESFKTKIGTDIFNRSQEHGTAIANTIWEWSKTDPFGHAAYLNARPDGYTPPDGPGQWEPTAPNFQKALFPYWGKTRTFAISETDKLTLWFLVKTLTPSFMSKRWKCGTLSRILILLTNGKPNFGAMSLWGKRLALLPDGYPSLTR